MAENKKKRQEKAKFLQEQQQLLAIKKEAY